MSTSGQAAGYLVGGIVGSFVPGVGTMIGAQIGGMIGGYLDPPKGPKGRPPSADQLAVQTSTYGAPMKRGYGTYATYGNVFWVKGNKLDAVEKKQKAGKGGSKQTASAWEIFGTFAVGFHLGEITAYKRIWFGSKLVYDAGSSDLGTVLATNEAGGSITLYTGTSTQLPDPLIQADMGVGSTPGYRGLAYIVVNNWPMAEWGNSLAGLQIKAELVVDGMISQYDRRVYVPSGLFDPYSLYPGPFNPRAADGMVKFNKGTLEYTVDYEGHVVSTLGAAADFGAPYYVGKMPKGTGVVFDQNVGIGGGDLLVGGTVFKSRTGSTTDAFCGACVGGDGRLYVLMSTASVGRLEIYDEDLNLLSSQPQSIYADPAVLSTPAIPGETITFCVENNGQYLWKADSLGGATQLDLYAISAAGALTHLWYYGGAFYGPYGDQACMAAADGVCFHVSNGGSLAIFDRSRIVTPSIVPLAYVLREECLKSGLLVTGDIDTSEITQHLRGYEIAQTAAIRAALEPLQAAWPFDVIPHGYQIKFVPRGKSSVATIDISEIGATAVNEHAVQITTSREMDSQLPRRVSVKYRNANREYDADVGPGASRLNTDAINVVEVDLALVMTEAEAAGVEQVLLYMYWLERHDVSFTLPPTYRHLEPTDVITINGDVATYVLRLKEINDLPDGRLECKAKYNAAAIYTPNAVAQTTANLPKTLSFAGPSALQLLDIPCVDSGVMNKPGLLAAVCGYYAGWPGGLLFRSDDAGQTWNDVQGFLPPGCTLGSAINSIGTVSRYSVDLGSTLAVRLVSGDLSSVTQDAMLSGANHFAYGSHGRWEIIAAQNCVEQADGSWHLTTLLRGRFGTEQYMGTHAVDDVIVLLDAASVRFIGMDIGSLNISSLWRPVTTGRAVDTAAETALAYTGVNLKPLSPVDLNGSRDFSTLNWTFTWNRRTRTPVEIFSGMAMPLGESYEAYEAEIWTAGHAALKRTITGLTSPTCNYPAAQQIADFGSEQQDVAIKVYPLSATIGRGYPLIATISRYVPLDPYIDFLVLGLHFDGTNGSTTFTDIKGHVFTAFGNAQLTTTGMKYGTACGLFDGSGDYIRTPYSLEWNPGTGDYCVEGWINPTTVSVLQTIIGAYNNPGATYGWNLSIKADASVYLSLRDSGGTLYEVISPASAVTINNWQHVAWSKQGTTYRIFVAGVKLAETTISATPFVNTSCGLILGRWDDSGTTGRDFSGKQDDFRIYKGAAVRTTNFTPPIAQFPDS